MQKLTEQQIKELRGWYGGFTSVRDAAQITGLSMSTVSKYFAVFRAEATNLEQPASNAGVTPSITTTHDERE